MICSCRNCYKRYDSNKSRAELRGYCSAKCQHKKARACGPVKDKNDEYRNLKNAKQIGDILWSGAKLNADPRRL